MSRSVVLKQGLALRKFLTAPSSQCRHLHQENDLSSDTEDNDIRRRNISGLDPVHQAQYHGQAPDLDYKTLKMRRKLFARLGLESGEDPRILWPTRSELLDAEQEEMEGAASLQQRLRHLQAEKQAREKERLARHKTIEANMEKMPKLIAEYYARLQKAEDDVKERQARKEELLEEAREYFGYRISARDPKFEQMIEERKEKEKKEARLRKKEEKKAKMKARLLEEARKMGIENIAETEKEEKKS